MKKAIKLTHGLIIIGMLTNSCGMVCTYHQAHKDEAAQYRFDSLLFIPHSDYNAELVTHRA